MSIPTSPSQGKVTVTRGGLTPGKIITSTKDENPLSPAIEVDFLFNPAEYSLKKSNTWEEQENDQQDGEKKFGFTKSGRVTLSLTLHFDSLMAAESRTKPYDVRYHTDNLWRMMERKPSSSTPNEEDPPLVEFVWGELTFVSFISSMTQKFTLFRDDGVPVRCEVQLELTQFNPDTSMAIENLEMPTPTTVIDSSRADLLAALSLGMAMAAVSSAPSPDTIASQTRAIMESNAIDDPLGLNTGTQINTSA